MTLLTLPRVEDEHTRRATAEWQSRVEASPVDTYVYRYFDADDRLLYVGATSNLDNRDSQHSRLAPWRAAAVRRDVEGPMHREHALHAECIAIESEKPQHNRYRSNGYTGPGSIPWWERVSELFDAANPDGVPTSVGFGALMRGAEA